MMTEMNRTKVLAFYQQKYFDYTSCQRIVSVIKEQVDTSYRLRFRLLRYHSLKEEERVVVVSTDENGNVFDDNFTQRLLSLSAIVTKDIASNDELLPISAVLDEREAELTEALEAGNGDLISDEIVKIENWAEDNRKALQQKLNDVDKAVEEKSVEFVKERNIRKKLSIQKEKNALNGKRDIAWREFDEKKTQLKTDKNKLVTQLYALSEAKVETVDEYSIMWKIK